MLLVRQVSSMRWTYFVKREVDLHTPSSSVRLPRQGDTRRIQHLLSERYRSASDVAQKVELKTEEARRQP